MQYKIRKAQIITWYYIYKLLLGEIADFLFIMNLENSKKLFEKWQDFIQRSVSQAELLLKILENKSLSTPSIAPKIFGRKKAMLS